MNALVKQENGKKVSNIEISVDACAELGGQVYGVITALRKVYQLCGLRHLTYVDTFQGFREKSDGTNPQTLFAFGEPHSRYGRFIYNNREWTQIVETQECRKFSDTLGTEILPTMTAPVIDAVENITREIQGNAFALLQMHERPRLSGKPIQMPSDIEIALTAHASKGRGPRERRKVEEPVIQQALNKAMDRWCEIVDANSILRQSPENKKKGALIELIASAQESKAIAAALLYYHNPDQALRMGQIPDIIKNSKRIPSLRTLRDNAHLFAHLTFPKDNGIWQQPEVQQAIRYTDLWPWLRKPFMYEMEREKLRLAHKNTADRAAVSYFLNILAKRPGNEDTLYILITHDGPLITDFIKLITRIDKHETKIRDSKEKGAGKQKRVVFTPISDEEFKKRELTPLDAAIQPYSAILTGAEFLTFVKREQKRVLKKLPMTHELNQAMEALTDAIKALEDSVIRDKQAFGITRGGTFAERVRRNTGSTSEQTFR